MTDWGAAPGTKKTAGGGSAGAASSWGGGGGGRKVSVPKVRSPEEDLTSSLVRLAKTIPSVQGGNFNRIQHTLLTKTPGLKPAQVQRVYDALRSYPGTVDLANKILVTHQEKHAGPNSALDYLNPMTAGETIVGKGLDLLSRPANAVMSTVAEAAREGGYQHADLGKLLTAAKEGAQNKRHDSISGIVQENRGYKLKGLGGFAANLGGSIALDPLTYASFGLSDAAKVGLKTASEVLGAERAAAVAKGGMNVLSAEEKLRLGKAVTDPVMKALERGVRGGLKISRPVRAERTIAGHAVPTLRLNEGRTIIPGPFAQAKAGRIIEGTAGHLSPEVATETTRVANLADDAMKRAQELHGRANLTELAGGDPARVTQLEHDASAFEKTAQDITARVDELKGADFRHTVEAGQALGHNPITNALSDSKMAEALRGVFVRRGNIAHKYGQGAAEMIDQGRVVARGTMQTLIKHANDALAHAAKETKVTNDELRNIIGPALDVGGNVASVPARLRPMHDALAEVRDRFTQAQLDAGVTRETALHQTDEYLARYLTHDAAELRKGKGPARFDTPIGGEPSLVQARSSNLGRRTENLDKNILDINAQGRPDLQFEDNPLAITLKRNAEAARDVGNKQFFDVMPKVRDRAGNRLFYTADEAAKDGIKLPDHWVEKELPGIGKVHAPEEIINEVTKVHELLVNDKALKGVLDGIDKWMTLWKSYATVPLPFGLGFHERNAMGNMFNNWLAGIKFTDPAYGQSMKIQYLASKGVRENGNARSLLKGNDLRLFDEAMKHDVIGEGFFHVDLPDAQHVGVQVPFRQKSGQEKLSHLIGKKGERLHGTKGGVLRPLNTENVLIKPGRKLGSTIEENARLAHFIAKKKILGSSAEASRSVRKYLFDYSDLTATEQNLFKRGMAFYTFTRKNLPVQVGALLRTPGKFSHIQLARQAAASQAEAPKGLYPSYLPELGAVPLPMSVSRAASHVPFFGPKADEQLSFAPDLPYLNAASAISPAIQLLASLPGVNKIPGLPRNQEGTAGAVRDLVSGTISGGAPGAAMSAIQAFAANKDFFSGRPLEGRVAAPAYALLPGMSQERVLNGKKQPTITAKSQFLSEALMPLLGKLSSGFPQGDYEQEKAPRRRISSLLGLRVYPLGKGSSRGEALRRLQSVQQLMADLRAQGIDIQSSRTKKKKGSGW